MDAETLRERLNHPVARELLGPEGPLARIAYTARDGTPRVIPVGFLWEDDQLVFWTAPGSAKVAALRESPTVAVTVDTETQPPHVLMLRGQVTVTEVDGVPDDYVRSNRLLHTEEEREAFAEQVRALYDSMVEIRLTPTWVRVLDFETSAPDAVMRLAEKKQRESQ